MKKKVAILGIAVTITILTLLLCSCRLTEDDKREETPFEIIKKPEAVKNLVYDGSQQELIVPGEVKGGRIEYWLRNGERWGSYREETPSMENAGEYEVRYQIIPDDREEKTVEEVLDCRIEKAPPKAMAEPRPQPNCQYWIYGSYLFTAGKADGGQYVFSKTEDGEFGRNIAFYQLGENTIFYKIKGDSNHFDSEVKSLSNTLYPKTVDFSDPEKGTITITGEEEVYTGNEIKPAIEVKDRSYSIEKSEYEVSYENNIDAGTAKIIVKDIEGGNFIVNAEKEFTIKKAIVKREELPENLFPQYTGEPVELVKNGTAEGIKFLFCGERDGVYTENLPTGTNAGNYEVWYKAEGDKNHEGVEPRSLTAKIRQSKVIEAEWRRPRPKQDLVFSGEAQELIIPGKPDGWTYLYSTKDYGPFTETIPAETDAGTYTVFIKKEADGNHYVPSSTITSKITCKIEKANSSVIIFAGAIYTGKELELLKTSEVVGGTIEYKKEHGEYGPHIPTGINAGKYKVYYRVTGDKNHKDHEGTIDCTIKSKTLTLASEEISLSGDTVYTGNEITPTVEIKDGVTVVPSSEYAVVYTNNVDAGTATVTLKDIDGGNYNVVGETKFDIAKANAKLEPAPIAKNNAFDGTNKDLIVAGKVVGDPSQTLQYSLDENGAYSENIPTATPPGEYKVYYRVPETANYNGIDKTHVTAKIFKVTYTLSPDEKSYWANGPYDESLTELSIPASWDSKPVSAIGENACANCVNLTKLIIPNTVTSIGINAFSGCVNLREVSCPAMAMKHIKKGTALKVVNITGGTEIPRKAFADNENTVINLDKLTIADSVLTVDDGAFPSDKTNVRIKVIVAPEIGLEIAKNHIAESSLIEFTLTKGTVVPEERFSAYGNLTKVNLPTTLESIDYRAFYNCSNLAELNIPDGVSIGKEAFCNCSNLTELNIPDGVSIGQGAFRQCVGIVALTIGNDVTIEENAFTFMGCAKSLQTITLGENERYKAENNCLINKSSDTLILGSNGISQPVDAAVIGEYAFYECQVNSITLLKATKIRDNAFGSSSVQSIAFPATLKDIGERAFANCHNLTSVVLPDSLQTIGGEAFLNCSGLKTVKLGNGVTEIGTDAFKYCDITDLYISDLKNWCEIEFANEYGNPMHASASRKKMYLNDNETTDIGIPSGIAKIKPYTFKNASYLTRITIGSDVTEISGLAFSGCSELSDVTVKNTVAKIGDRAFSGCGKIKNLTLPYLGATSSEPGTLAYILSAETIGIMPEGETALTITGATNIAANACSDAKCLSSVTTGDNVSEIGDNAFMKCTGITKVSIGAAVSKIGDNAFMNCAGITELFIGESVNKIGKYAFQNCTGLRTLKIEADITENNLGEYIFSGCNNIADATANTLIMSKLDTEQLEKAVLTSGDKIYSYTFAKCKKLTSLTICDEIEVIKTNAFFNCPCRLTIDLRNTRLTTIERRAFEECQFEAVYLPNTLTTIDNDAFDHSFIRNYYYEGTKANWEEVFRGRIDLGHNFSCYVHCSDGNIEYQ